MKKFIIFRTDRLGDFLIVTSIIKGIKQKFKDSHITVIGSPNNLNIIKLYSNIDKFLIYKKNDTIKKKIKLFKKINKNNYYASLSLDGKSFSNLVNLLIKAKFKLGLSYKYNLINFPFRLSWSKPNFIYNFCVFDYFNYFTSKTDLKKVEHLPSILLDLLKKINLRVRSIDPYFFEVKSYIELLSKKIIKNKIKSKYILLNLDEKWLDIKNIDFDLYKEVYIFQRKIKKKIVITSNKNNYLYYKKFKNNAKKNKNIIILENLNLQLFERLIAKSYFSISCHSGFLVQVAGFNKANIIDIINKNDLLWYSCWKPLNTKHMFIFKSNGKVNNSLRNIFNEILSKTKKF